MSTRTCAVPGCSKLCGPRVYSPYCPAHRKALRCHGHPEQRPVTFYELAPHMTAVRGVVKRNPDSEAWAIVGTRWGHLLEQAEPIAAAPASGLPFHKPTWQAADMLLKVAAVADAAKVREVMLALYLLRMRDPHRFRDDKAFTFTLVRRLRHLAPMAKGRYWSHKAQRSSCVYREAPPRAVAVLGAWLGEVFGLAGFLVAEALCTREVKAAGERARLAEAVGAFA